MLPERLNTQEKAYSFLSMFLKESYGTKDKYDMYYKFLTNISDISEEVYNRIDIFCKRLVDEKCQVVNGEIDYSTLSETDNYFDLNGVSRNSTEDKILDILGDFFGVSRNVYVSFVDHDGYLTSTNKPDGVSYDSTTEKWSGWMKLNNFCFLFYIQCSAFKNTFDGTRKNLAEIYGYNLSDSEVRKMAILMPQMLGMKYEYARSDQDDKECDIILTKRSNITKLVNNNFISGVHTSEIICLFLNGLTHIESLGINYLLFTSVRFGIYNMISYGISPSATTTGYAGLRSIVSGTTYPLTSSSEDFPQIGILK